MSNIRYASIRKLDISNGENIGVALFTQGCPFNPHCHNCFNPDTWDFNGGKEWTTKTEDKLIELASKPYIKRLSILGGEPLADENLDGVFHLVNRFRLLFPNKSIWLYSGYTWNQLFEDDEFDISGGITENQTRRAIILSCDVMVDGRYIDSQRNPSKKWAGSDNQHVIDIKQSLKQGEMILYCD